ncbi:CynX/NimT family MFS transporter [Bacillus thermotolerans]|uniref:CynX/NimT family MFS transporter n=1 Tax=Bacillus thermotolerans TaxID=1221996 RepID=UPI0005894A25|nr:MFS transporter [Bacillus thermotolerans]KKB44748.1 Cyanate permease [Bacillus thermotolerans]
MISQEKLTQARVSTRWGKWVLIVGIIFAAANLRAPLTSIGPIVEMIRQDTGMSSTATGMLTTLPLLAFAFFSPFAPKISRRIGLEYTLFGALLLLSIGIVLRSVPSVSLLFAGTALLGIAIAIGNVLLPSMIKQEFPYKVGLMTGVYAASMNLSAAIASGVSIPLTQGLGLGWRSALSVWALLAVVSIVLWIPQLRFRRQPSKNTLKIGESLWHSNLAWKVTLFMGLQSTVFYTVITWLPSILHEQGISQSEAGWLLSLTQFAGLLPTFIVPILAGRSSNQRWLVALTASFLIVGYLGLLGGLTSLAPLLVILIGIATGSAFSLATMFFVLRTHNAEQAAELSGMAQSVGYLLAAVGPILFGFIHDATGSWTIPLLILLVGAVLLFIIGMEAGSSKYVTASQQEKKSTV